jgi:hypothetical protein
MRAQPTKIAFMIGCMVGQFGFADHGLAGVCQCRAQNQIYDEGVTVCLKMPQGMQLMECVRELNVTSWKKVQDGCPQARSSRQEPTNGV